MRDPQKDRSIFTRIRHGNASCSVAKNGRYRILGYTFGVEKSLENYGFEYNRRLMAYEGDPKKMTAAQRRAAEKMIGVSKVMKGETEDGESL